MERSKLYVGNLDYSVTEEQLKELFSEYGVIKSVDVIDGRGFGFVEFSETSEAEKAKDELDGTEFAGRTMRIDEAHPPKR